MKNAEKWGCITCDFVLGPIPLVCLLDDEDIECDQFVEEMKNCPKLCDSKVERSTNNE